MRPIFDRPDLFDPRRVRLADIDGSGTSDIIYVGHDGISLYFNQSGNFWSAPHRLSHFPRWTTSRPSRSTDLLGNGTACLVWSSPLAADARQPMRYIDLMGGQKPHLLVHVDQQHGRRDRHLSMRHRRSSICGTAWKAGRGSRQLPFPVHVIERVESRDLVSNTTLVSTYRYRHGYLRRRRARVPRIRVCRAARRRVGGRRSSICRRSSPRPGSTTAPSWKTAELEAYFKDPANGSSSPAMRRRVFLPDTELPPDLNVRRNARGGARAERQHPAPGGLCRRRLCQGGAALQRLRAQLQRSPACSRGDRIATPSSSPIRARPSTITTSAIRPIRASAMR